MTSAQRQQGQRLVLLAILVVAVLLGVALAAIVPRLLVEVPASYGASVYLPDSPTYCPGDVLRASYRVQRRVPGPVEIMGSWQNVDRGTSLLNETTQQYANIVESGVAITASLAITIPTSPQMLPGSRWRYVRSVRQLGQAEFNMFTVPFVIAGDCN